MTMADEIKYENDRGEIVSVVIFPKGKPPVVIGAPNPEAWGYEEAKGE